MFSFYVFTFPSSLSVGVKCYFCIFAITFGSLRRLFEHDADRICVALLLTADYSDLIAPVCMEKSISLKT